MVNKLRRRCAVLGCNRYREIYPNLKFFYFPRHQERCYKWMELTNNPVINALTAQAVRRRFVICELHFTTKQFATPERQKLLRKQYPSINLNGEKTSENVLKMAQRNYHCVLPWCDNHEYPDPYFEYYTFPKDETRHSRWMNILTRAGYKIINYDRYVHRFCSKHFMDFDDPAMQEYVLPMFYIKPKSNINLNIGPPDLVYYADIEDKENVEMDSSTDCINDDVINDNLEASTIDNKCDDGVLDKSKNSEFTEVCRLCASPVDSNYRFLNDTIKEEILSIFPNFDLELYPEPYVCTKCVDLLKISTNFQKKLQNSQNELRKLMSNALSNCDNDQMTTTIEISNDINDRFANGKIVIENENGDDVTHELKDAPILQINNDNGKWLKCSNLIKKFACFQRVEVEQIDVSPKGPTKTHDIIYELTSDGQRWPDVFDSGSNGFYTTIFGRSKFMRDFLWGDPPYMCERCGKMFDNRTSFSMHMRKYSSETIFCDVCGKIVKKINEFNHKMSHQKCRTCGLTFNSKREFSEHWTVHPPEYNKQCHVCGKSFFYSGSYAAHIKTHTRVPIYKCRKCGLTFGDVKLFRQHLIKHRSLYECKICNKGVESLKQHNRMYHSNHPVICKQCGKQLKNEYRLRIHVKRIHDRQGFYACEQCGKVVKYEQSLIRHREICHENKVDHRCSFCDKLFWRMDNLIKHMVAKHGCKVEGKVDSIFLKGTDK